ncbi:3-hydroxyacyl-CoA dehydrogenase family protein [Pseudoflavonifractor phocaeensis]|uniref:3-hydroxyacyl-CoA dehydrogenase family protein n=1 Tax=Pseudoflavonifractor phocaeensis TaxID=1870988 RepID=UPI001F2D191C|nr:3-hydroxyacyl-CoA dehydrogenase NAD-binding domain-containing protein [Pseudoflavonifractor phocaeensis]MCF2595636.1 3-hydroxybutyryl-CoA dehydrogenase [Pseudoflavonifractor phocaeensis]MDY3905408.1 3-hydroxyacyl-CoA dehydrogenase NAD-binding domain-containing protein [Lawsonibacter sp.]
MAIEKIFVVGAGLMGSGIAQTAICNGYTVTLNDQRQEALERGKAGIVKMLKRDVEKGRMTEEECEAALARLSLDSSMNGAQNADLVIEAIYENLEAKQAVFKRLEEVCPASTIFASNTSSISLTALAAATKRPDRVVGMHFFSPVPKMRLCEVIFGLLTAQDVLEQIKEVGERMGKTLILSDDKPGFIVNRALLPMLNEACVIVGSNIGTVEDIDNGMKLGCNHPMGPLELADMVGLDILLNVMMVLDKEYGAKYHPSMILRKMVTAGFLGRKSGAGFYLYEDGKKMGVNPVLTQVHSLEEQH